MSKKIQIVIFLLIVAIAAGIGLYKAGVLNKPKDKKADTQVKADPNQPNITKVAPEKLPEKFPADFPIEAGAEILANYNTETSTVFQATRRFVTAKSQADNFKFYLDYLNKNGWTILGQMDTSTTKSIAAEKNGAQLTISFTQSAKQYIIDVSFTSKK